MGGPLSFGQVEARLRGKSFGIVGTVALRDLSHTTGVCYGLAPPGSAFALYVITEKRTREVRNIRMNPSASFVVPFPRYLLRFVSASVVQSQGTAEALPLDHEEGLRAFESSRVLRMVFEQTRELGETGLVFIRVCPLDHLDVYGLGFSLRQMMRDLTAVEYRVEVPTNRRAQPGPQYR